MSYHYSYAYMQKFKKLILTVSLIISFNSLFAQAYYSDFDDAQAASHLTVTNPAGTLCIAPSVTNSTNLTNKSQLDYAKIVGVLSVPLLCSPSTYKLKMDLNLGALSFLPPGFATGVRLKTSALLTAAVLGSNITINTYLNGTLAETKTNNQLLGISALALDADEVIYFITTKPFNKVELVLGTSIIKLGLLFEIDIYHAFAATNVVLPVSVSNVKGAVSGNNATLMWTANNEIDVDRYEIERSVDGKNFQLAGTVIPKPGTNAIKQYSFAQTLVLSGNYYYRIKSIDKNGSFTYSYQVAINFTSGKKITAYPTLLRSGEKLWIQTADATELLIEIYDMLGKRILLQKNATAGLTSITTPQLMPGSYILKATNATGDKYQTKFLIK